MNHLPEDLIFFNLLKFLEDEEKPCFLAIKSSYTRLWMKKSRVIKLTRRKMEYKTDPNYWERLLSMIEDPGEQLEYSCFSDAFEKLPCTRLKEFDSSYEDFLAMRSKSSEWKAKEISLYDEFDDTMEEDTEDIIQLCLAFLQQMCDRSDFIKSVRLEMHEQELEIPHLPSLEDLSITGCSLIKSYLRDYASHLQSLELIGCEGLMDVSMLGNIPSLTIQFCNGFQDISALNNNRVIDLKNNAKIKDYSKSFENSKKIKLSITGHNRSTIQMNFTQCKQLQSLSLSGTNDVKVTVFPQLPPSIKRLELGGYFAKHIKEWKENFVHLTTISVKECTTLTSLEGYGLDRIPIVKLRGLNSLTSLNGLGGRNQLVTVAECEAIYDFSAIHSVPEVSVNGCDELTSLESLAYVQRLTLLSSNAVNFSGCTDHLQRLQVSSHPRVTKINFQGLQIIPDLEIDQIIFEALITYVSEGGLLLNRKITVTPHFFVVTSSLMDKMENQWKRYLSSSYQLFYQTNHVVPEMVLLRISSH